MTLDSVLVTVSVAISSLILALGAWLIAGWYLADLWPANVRYMVGGVMVLYGVYRIATSRSRFRGIRDGLTNEAHEDDDRQRA